MDPSYLIIGGLIGMAVCFGAIGVGSYILKSRPVVEQNPTAPIEHVEHVFGQRFVNQEVDIDK